MIYDATNGTISRGSIWRTGGALGWWRRYVQGRLQASRAAINFYRGLSASSRVAVELMKPPPFRGGGFPSFGAGAGDRTRMALSSRGILSPLRLPVPPPRHTREWFGNATEHYRDEGRRVQGAIACGTSRGGNSRRGGTGVSPVKDDAAAERGASGATADGSYQRNTRPAGSRRSQETDGACGFGGEGEGGDVREKRIGTVPGRSCSRFAHGLHTAPPGLSMACEDVGVLEPGARVFVEQSSTGWGNSRRAGARRSRGVNGRGAEKPLLFRRTQTHYSGGSNMRGRVGLAVAPLARVNRTTEAWMSGLHGVVLAGGISSRMGFPKALMPLGNSFFLLTIYAKLTASGAKPVHMVINTGLASSLEAQKARFPDGTFVLNPEPGLGQIQSLRLGLRAAADGGAEAALVALVDLPLVQEAIHRGNCRGGNGERRQDRRAALRRPPRTPHRHPPRAVRSISGRRAGQDSPRHPRPVRCPGARGRSGRRRHLPGCGLAGGPGEVQCVRGHGLTTAAAGCRFQRGQGTGGH